MNNICERNCVAAILLKIEAIYSLWLPLKSDKVGITQLIMDIQFQTTDHVLGVEKENNIFAENTVLAIV